jgi:hypothetical protein
MTHTLPFSTTSPPITRGRGELVKLHVSYEDSQPPRLHRLHDGHEVGRVVKQRGPTRSSRAPRRGAMSRLRAKRRRRADVPFAIAFLGVEPVFWLAL